ncbi:hypothetical protein N7466_011082 [Penicillium verhagenii]|uniref:uncharacterized protein n=1 Tax=Penicillium verhagenii TaxID=1562060 RepID=UPI0025459BF4|nr:uncharacterized protein N7466_011082 [Penicillium verhagenii]KAJ5917528.1 hypothetical protein N7466_011082 [Penicillium verhagenii]
MAIPNQIQGTSADGSEFESLCQSSENADLFSVPMDEGSEHWPVPDSHFDSPLQVDPFRPLIRDRTGQNQDNTEPMNQAAEILQLYSKLWESYSSKQAEFYRLQEENDMLCAANVQLCQKLQIIDRQLADQGALLEYSKQGFENFRNGLRAVLEAWDDRPGSK